MISTTAAASVSHDASQGSTGNVLAMSANENLSAEPHDASLEIVTINVGGKRFQTYEKTLARFPETLLGSAAKRAKYFNPETGEYFIDRHRSAFTAILYYYQSNGTLVRPEHVPPHVFAGEITFYELGQEILETVQLEAGVIEEEEEKPMPTIGIFRQLWCLFEYPESSKFAKFLAIFSVVVISFSLVIFCVETLPVLKEPDTIPGPNGSDIENPNIGKVMYEEYFFLINTLIIAWFTFEYLVRFIVSPDKIKFVLAPLNVIDFLSILPYYVTLSLQGRGGSIAVLRVVRVVRVFRVFKLSRHSRGLQILGNTLRASLNELMMLMFFLFIGVMIFASCVYYAEMNEDQGFDSIPHSFWWAVVTMTTVGYGDISPTTFEGKIIGALCAISGVLTIALPVPVIVSNFEHFYNKELNRRKQEELRKEEERKEAEKRGGSFKSRFSPLKKRSMDLDSLNSNQIINDANSTSTPDKKSLDESESLATPDKKSNSGSQLLATPEKKSINGSQHMLATPEKKSISGSTNSIQSNIVCGVNGLEMCHGQGADGRKVPYGYFMEMEADNRC